MRHAFTLIELLIVVIIIALLASLVIATIGMVREAGRQTRCAVNLRQISAAMISYSHDNRGWLPVPFHAQYPALPKRTLEFILTDFVDQPRVWWCPSNRLARTGSRTLGGITLSGKRSYAMPGQRVLGGSYTQAEQRAVVSYYEAEIVSSKWTPTMVRSARLALVSPSSFILTERHDEPGNGNVFADYGGLVAQGPTLSTCRDAHRTRNQFVYADGSIIGLSRRTTWGAGMTLDETQDTADCWREVATKPQARGPWSIHGDD